MIPYKRLTILLSVCCALMNPAQAESNLAFEAREDGSYVVDTGVVRGVLRKKGESLGLGNVVHIPTGTALSRKRGWFGHYRLLTIGKRHKPDGWSWQSTAELLSDGAVRAHWAQDEKHAFEMTATYRFINPTTMEVETTVTAQADLEDFELILPSYFGPGFDQTYVWAEQGGEPTFVEAKESDGYWMMFPLDDAKWNIVKDGRWDQRPHPLDWVRKPTLAIPMALRTHQKSGLSSLVMAHPDDVKAIGTPFTGEYHLSNYFCLFGQSLGKGETVRAKLRLVIVPDLTDPVALDLYHDFLDGHE